MPKNVKIWLSIIALSVSSAAIGGVVAAYFIKHKMVKMLNQGPKGTRFLAMKVLKNRLKLSEQQTQEIRPAITNAQKKLFELRQSHQPQIKAILDEVLREIEPKLDIKQKEDLSLLKDRLFRKLNHKFR